MKSPVVFLSYSWDSLDHQKRVKRLYATLRSQGIDARMDFADVHPGQDLNIFMERSMTSPDIDKVLLLLSPGYKMKADTMTGGVGQEALYARDHVVKDVEQRRFIPVLFAAELQESGAVNRDASTPIFLRGRLTLDLHNDATWDDNTATIIEYLYDRAQKPVPLGPRPVWAAEAPSPSNFTLLVTALAALGHHFPDGTDPIQALLSSDLDFTLTQEDPMRQELETLETAGWITQTFLSMHTPDQPQFRVRIRGTPHLSRAALTPDVQRAWRDLTPRSTPDRHPMPDGAGVHGDVQRLTQSKWALGEALDDLVREGKRQRLAALLEAAFTKPEWTQHVQEWVDTTPSLRALPWLPELILEALTTDLTAEHAGQRYAMVNLIMTATVEGAPHRAVTCAHTLLTGLKAHVDWEDAHWNLLVAGVEPFWLLADRSARPVTPAVLNNRHQVVQHLLRAAYHAADADHTQIVNGVWTAVATLVYDTGDEELLESVAGVRGVQAHQVMTRLTNRTIGELLNAVDHARRTPALPGPDREMRHRLVDLIARDTLAYAKQIPVSTERFEWLVWRSGMALDAQGNIISKYVGPA